MSTQKKLTIVYDADCGFCSYMTNAWAERLGRDNVDIFPGQSRPEFKAQMEATNSWLVINAKGEQRFRFDGVLEVMRHVEGLALLAAILSFHPFRLAGNIGYRVVSNNRRLISKIFFKDAVCKIS